MTWPLNLNSSEFQYLGISDFRVLRAGWRVEEIMMTEVVVLCDGQYMLHMKKAGALRNKEEDGYIIGEESAIASFENLSEDMRKIMLIESQAHVLVKIRPPEYRWLPSSSILQFQADFASTRSFQFRRSHSYWLGSIFEIYSKERRGDSGRLYGMQNEHFDSILEGGDSAYEFVFISNCRSKWSPSPGEPKPDIKSGLLNA